MQTNTVRFNFFLVVLFSCLFTMMTTSSVRAQYDCPCFTEKQIIGLTKRGEVEYCMIDEQMATMWITIRPAQFQFWAERDEYGEYGGCWLIINDHPLAAFDGMDDHAECYRLLDDYIEWLECL